MERLIKDYERNSLGRVSSLTGSTRNKSTSFSCLDMGTRPLSSVFLLIKFSMTESPKMLRQILADLFVITNVSSFIQIHGTKQQRQ